MFAFSGLRFTGLPSHMELILSLAEAGAGGRETGTNYLLRNSVMLSAAFGGYLWISLSLTIAFTIATGIALIGTRYFLAVDQASNELAATARPTPSRKQSGANIRTKGQAVVGEPAHPLSRISFFFASAIASRSAWTSSSSSGLS